MAHFSAEAECNYLYRCEKEARRRQYEKQLKKVEDLLNTECFGVFMDPNKNTTLAAKKILDALSLLPFDERIEE